MLETLASSPLLVIMLVLALGAALGAIPFGPLRLGAAGALFVGLAFGAADPRLGEGLGLIQTLGLALFVYTVGIAAGATFFQDLKKQLPLMGVAVATLALAAGAAIAAGKLLGLSPGIVAGTFAGSLTSTPALAAATSAVGNQEPAVGYSLGYPVGVVLAILAVALVVGRSWPGTRDTPSLAAAGIVARTAAVERPTALSAVPGWRGEEIKMSYLRRDGETRVIAPGERLREGDEVLVVGSEDRVETAINFLGHAAENSLTHHRGEVDFKRFLVSNPATIGRTVAELNLPGKLGGVITRVRRGDVDTLAEDDLVLQPGDRVLAVVPSDSMDEAIALFGDSERKVSEIDALATGIGMSLGLLLGLVTVPLPGGVEFSLGPAAGPLVVGMVLGALHTTGPLAWDLPQTANLTIRQLGLLLFLATVGLANGQAFAEVAFTATGAQAAVLAALVLGVSAVVFLMGARLLGLSSERSAGAFAGYVGQPAVLAYATSRSDDERVEAGYAALFALAIVVKLLAVQVIAVA